MPEKNTQQDEDKSPYAKKVWMTGGILALLIILLILFKTLFSILLLTLAGALFAIYFYGCANFFKKYLPISAGWSLALSIIINLVLLVAFFWFVGARLQQQVSELTDTFPQTIGNAKAYLQKSTVGNKALEYLNSSGSSQKTMSIAKEFFSSSFGILSDVYIILLLGMFFIANPFIYKKGIVHLLPPKAKDKGAALLDQIRNVLKNWIKGQLFGFVFIALLTALGLWAIGMPLILTLALIAGLLNFIPNFGPIIALIPAGLIGLTQGTSTAILVLCLYTLIQVVQSAVTQPLIQKKMVSIPPALIIFGQVAIGLLGGFWGVLLATPVVAIIMTVVNKLYVEQQSHHKYEVKKANT
jgi:predicted PurR-regulated permease PerM